MLTRVSAENISFGGGMASIGCAFVGGFSGLIYNFQHKDGSFAIPIGAAIGFMIPASITAMILAARYIEQKYYLPSEAEIVNNPILKEESKEISNPSMRFFPPKLEHQYQTFVDHKEKEENAINFINQL